MAILLMLRSPMPQAVWLDPSVAPNAASVGWTQPRNQGTNNAGFFNANFNQNPYTIRPTQIVSNRPIRWGRRSRGFLGSRFLPLP